MGFHSPLPWRLRRRVLRIKNPDIRLRRITYPPELLLAPNRRYPPSLGEGLGDDGKPTPALPKGGGIMFFCPSVINKGVGVNLPSLGEGSGVGILSDMK